MTTDALAAAHAKPVQEKVVAEPQGPPGLSLVLKMNRTQNVKESHLSLTLWNPYEDPQTPLNPKPSTLNPQPCTLSPEPSTLNPKPKILHNIRYTLKPVLREGPIIFRVFPESPFQGRGSLPLLGLGLLHHIQGRNGEVPVLRV